MSKSSKKHDKGSAGGASRQSGTSLQERSEARKLRSLGFLRENFLVSEQALEQLAGQSACEFSGDVLKGEACSLFAFCTECTPEHSHHVDAHAIDFEAAKASVAAKLGAATSDKSVELDKTKSEE